MHLQKKKKLKKLTLFFRQLKHLKENRLSRKCLVVVIYFFSYSLIEIADFLNEKFHLNILLYSNGVPETAA